MALFSIEGVFTWGRFLPFFLKVYAQCHANSTSVFDSYLNLRFPYWFFKRLLPTSPLKLVYINRQPARGYHL